MGDLSRNFSRHEFRCRGGSECCDSSAPISPLLISVLQEIRDRVGSSMNPTCGFRCQKHNASLPGGYKSDRTSQHCLGLAADFPAPRGLILVDFYDLCDEVLREMLDSGGGLGRYPGRKIVHIDVRSGMSWRKVVEQ